MNALLVVCRWQWEEVFALDGMPAISRRKLGEQTIEVSGVYADWSTERLLRGGTSKKIADDRLKIWLLSVTQTISVDFTDRSLALTGAQQRPLSNRGTYTKRPNFCEHYT